MTKGCEFANVIHDRTQVRLSQLELKHWLDESDEVVIEEKPRQQYTWYDPGVASIGNSLREPGYTTDVILRSDFSHAMTPTEQLRFVLPLPIIPSKLVGTKKWRHRYSVVNDTDVDYSLQRGGAWTRD